MFTRAVYAAIAVLALTVPGLAQSLPRFGAGAKVSTLGYGLEAATAVSSRANVRAGVNLLNQSFNFNESGIEYDSELRLRSFEGHFDFFLGTFRVSPGLLFYNNNRVESTANVSAGRVFTLGGRDYSSNPTDPVTGTGEFDLAKRKVSPMITVGTGNLLRRSGRRFSITFDAGILFQGSPKATIDLRGTACAVPVGICQPIASSPQIQADIRAEEAKFNAGDPPYDDFSKILKYYPIFSIGFGYRIK